MIETLCKIPFIRRAVLGAASSQGWFDKAALKNEESLDLFCKDEETKKSVLKYATELQFSNLPNQDKLEYAFTDSKGLKWFRWVQDTFIPIARFDQLQINLIEMESRISRKSLESWIQNVSKVLEKNNSNKIREEVGHLLGGLKERLDILHEPELMLRFVSGMHIREDQLDQPEVWNERLEENKFQQLLKDQDGHLYEFLKKNGLAHLFKSSAITPEEWNQHLKSQIKAVAGFDVAMAKVGSTLNRKSSSTSTTNEQKESESQEQKESAMRKSKDSQ